MTVTITYYVVRKMSNLSILQGGYSTIPEEMKLSLEPQPQSKPDVSGMALAAAVLLGSHI